MEIQLFKPEDFLILVVDDVSKNLQVIGAMLDQVGYSTTFATSGQQALDRITKAKPDLILLDLMMPEINGLQVCEKLKAEPQNQEIPIIFLTASDEINDLVQAFERGAVDYITKPFKTPELLARVRTHLELKRTRDHLKTALQELEKLATTDSLTGIANRRHLLTLGEQEFYRAKRYKRPLSILMIDVDFFKQINDRYGHAVGDETLKVMVQVILTTLRQVDCFGRYGGEEFVVFLPETDLDQAMDVAERIRQTVAKVLVPVQKQLVPISISIGVAALREDDHILNTILIRADKALYEAKQLGRNQVISGETVIEEE